MIKGFYEGVKKRTGSIAKSGLEKLAVSAMALSLPLGGALYGLKTANADLIVKTVPQAGTWVANGTTEYRMDVVVNSTEPDVYDKEFIDGSWRVYLPDQVDFVRSELPDNINNPSQNASDFWYGFFMNPAYNRVDDGPPIGGGPSGWVYHLDDNVRLVNNSSGPLNANDKVVGHYFVTVKPGTPNGNYGFGLSSVIFSDTLGTAYMDDNGNGNMTILDVLDNVTFTVGSQMVPQDRDADGDVDGVDFSVFASCFNRAGNPPRTFGCTTTDANAFDTDGDNDVDGVDFSVFASCFNGAGNLPRTFGCTD